MKPSEKKPCKPTRSPRKRTCPVKIQGCPCTYCTWMLGAIFVVCLSLVVMVFNSQAKIAVLESAAGGVVSGRLFNQATPSSVTTGSSGLPEGAQPLGSPQVR